MPRQDLRLGFRGKPGSFGRAIGIRSLPARAGFRSRWGPLPFLRLGAAMHPSRWSFPLWLAALACVSSAQVRSTFTATDEGWRSLGDNQSIRLATGGNPTGCFDIDDFATGAHNFAIAPRQFLGDWSSLAVTETRLRSTRSRAQHVGWLAVHERQLPLAHRRSRRGRTLHPGGRQLPRRQYLDHLRGGTGPRALGHGTRHSGRAAVGRHVAARERGVRQRRRDRAPRTTSPSVGHLARCSSATSRASSMWTWTTGPFVAPVE